MSLSRADHDAPRWHLADARYQSGFGNEFESEAETGALPPRNNPLHVPLGLYSELMTATSFTAERARNRRTYAFRIRPSVSQGRMRQIENARFMGNPFGEVAGTQMRWNPFNYSKEPIDFIDSMATVCGSGSPAMHVGAAIHIFSATRSMYDRAFANCDAEMLIIPQEGCLRLITEMGILDVAPGELALIPRGIRISVALPDGRARGFACENFGRPLELPVLGPLGSTGLANPWDFKAPTAFYEDRDTDFSVVARLHSQHWQYDLDHSPFDVVAWRGTCSPFKYNMANFAAMGSTVADHPDPTLYTALTSTADPVLGANMDLLIFPPRWSISTDTFRPAPFHRNAATEFSALIHGAHESKASGAAPGSFVLHNGQLPHGPDLATYTRALGDDCSPRHTGNSLMFAIETRFPFAVTPYARNAPELQSDYPDCWRGFANNFRGIIGRRRNTEKS